MAAKAQFHWDDPLLLDQQLTDEERMIRDAANAYCQERLLPRVTERLLRLQAVKYVDWFVSLPFASFRNGGPQVRVSSPTPGRSILTTSAPRSARICVHHGPASTRERSRTLMPSRAAAVMGQFENAAIPVIARPRISAWMSCVPS